MDASTLHIDILCFSHTRTFVFGESRDAIPADFDIEMRVEAAGDVEIGGGGGSWLAIDGDGGGHRGGWRDGIGEGIVEACNDDFVLNFWRLCGRWRGTEWWLASQDVLVGRAGLGGNWRHGN